MGLHRKVSLSLGVVLLLSSLILAVGSYSGGISGFSIIEDVDYYVGSSVFILLFVLGIYFVYSGTKAE